MATKKKPSAAQLAARKKFVEMVRAKAKAKKAATKKAATKKVATHKDTKSHNVNVKVVSGITPNEYALHEIKIHIKKRDDAIKGIEKWSNMAKSTKIIATKKEYNKYLDTYKKLVLYHTLQIKKLKDSIK